MAKWRDWLFRQILPGDRHTNTRARATNRVTHDWPDGSLPIRSRQCVEQSATKVSRRLRAFNDRWRACRQQATEANALRAEPIDVFDETLFRVHLFRLDVRNANRLSCVSRELRRRFHLRQLRAEKRHLCRS